MKDGLEIPITDTIGLPEQLVILMLQSEEVIMVNYKKNSQNNFFQNYSIRLCIIRIRRRRSNFITELWRKPVSDN